MQNNIFDVYDSLITFNRKTREKFGPFNPAMDAIVYAKQFKTVKIDSGRATGKSTYIRKILDALPVHGQRALVVVPFMTMAPAKNEWFDVVSGSNGLNFFRGKHGREVRNYDWIIFDEIGALSFINEDKSSFIASIYRFTANQDLPQQTYLFMGAS